MLVATALAARADVLCTRNRHLFDQQVVSHCKQFLLQLPAHAGAGGGPVDAERAWRIEWSPMFFSMCQATGGSLLFDLDLYRQLSPGARRLFLKLKDRFWRSKRVFLNVDDLTIHGMGFSADRTLKKRKFDLTACIRASL
jgi:hypothetical protein